MVKLLAIFILILSFILPNCSEQFKIGLYYNKDIECVTIENEKGIYDVFGDNKLIFRLKPNRSLMVWQCGDSVIVRTVQKSFGKFAKIEIKQIQSLFIAHPQNKNIFRIKPIIPELKSNSFNDDLIITSAHHTLRLVNCIQADNYVAAVAESEGGAYQTIEFYKAQTVIARTYAYQNKGKHTAEGFDLCNTTHCQAYNHRCLYDNKIIDAAQTTTNQVIVDENNKLINAVFHSNCGGMTANSEDSWNSHLPYLRSVADPYCTSSLNSKWKKDISLQLWKEFLLRYGFSSEEISVSSNLTLNQSNRKRSFILNNDSLPLFHFREEFNLKSTFFEAKVAGANVHLEGRGFGHGVGMCQEGAMKMAVSGKLYTEIIEHYYTNVKIVHKSDSQKANYSEKIRETINDTTEITIY